MRWLAIAELLPGALVTSLAGRDRGTVYVVVKILGPGRVAVADGKSRPAARPKEKNVKHLALAATPPATAVQRLKSRQDLTDEDLRDIIQSLRV